MHHLLRQKFKQLHNELNITYASNAQQRKLWTE